VATNFSDRETGHADIRQHRCPEVIETPMMATRFVCGVVNRRHDFPRSNRENGLPIIQHIKLYERVRQSPRRYTIGAQPESGGLRRLGTRALTWDPTIKGQLLRMGEGANQSKGSRLGRFLQPPELPANRSSFVPAHRSGAGRIDTQIATLDEENYAASRAGTGNAVTDLIFSMANLDVTFFNATAPISFL
jgi:hypothetical protein